MKASFMRSIKRPLVFLKRAVRRLFILVIVKPLACLAFDRRYLRGRHFRHFGVGWTWAWRALYTQKLLGYNRSCPWPTSPQLRVLRPQSIVFDPDDLNNFQTFGCYFQGSPNARIVIGKGIYVAPNVGFITSNHDPRDPRKHMPAQGIFIGRNCWIGMNSVILPGVTLGDRTTVAAGSVVGRSFPDGNCIIGGSPARVLQYLKSEE